MNLNETFPSRWLTGDEIDEPRVVTINEVEIVEFDSRERPGTKDKKIALHFRGEEKGMICNVGMRKILIGFFGPETDEWLGKRIRIMAVPFTSEKGETSMVCRIHPKRPEAAVKPAAKPAPSDNDGFDTDEIP